MSETKLKPAVEASKPATGETVIIGCRLPSGVTLEVGLQTLERTPDGKYFTMVKRLDNYERIVLKGWHHHNVTGLQMPAGVGSERPYLNRNVSKAAWEEWKSKNGRSWLLKNDILFEAANEADAQVKAIDAMKGTPTMLLPLTKDQLPKDIETADFIKERQSA